MFTYVGISTLYSLFYQLSNTSMLSIISSIIQKKCKHLWILVNRFFSNELSTETNAFSLKYCTSSRIFLYLVFLREQDMQFVRLSLKNGTYEDFCAPWHYMFSWASRSLDPWQASSTMSAWLSEINMGEFSQDCAGKKGTTGFTRNWNCWSVICDICLSVLPALPL